MIIGSGSIAKLIKDREGSIFFCSGVGNSQCKDNDQFKREADLLNSIPDDGKSLFYFSTISKYTHNNRYVFHKICMETRVMTFKNYNIVRLGNIWECTNPNTFLNAIKSKQRAGEPVEIRNEYKYMISADQLNMVLQGLPLTGKNEISIFSEMLTVEECLKRK